MLMKFVIDGTAGLVMHPSRYQILQCLRKANEPLFVEQIAKLVNIHPRMVSHHLDILEEGELVESKYELVKVNGSKRGVAVRLCKATSKADEVFLDIKESVT
jgi:DNA-binding transcriptional ArsR family regulator